MARLHPAFIFLITAIFSVEEMPCLAHVLLLEPCNTMAGDISHCNL